MNREDIDIPIEEQERFKEEIGQVQEDIFAYLVQYHSDKAYTVWLIAMANVIASVLMSTRQEEALQGLEVVHNHCLEMILDRKVD